MITATEVSPGGFAGSGCDDLGFLVFGFRADELKDGGCGDRVDVVVLKKDTAASPNGADMAGPDDAE